MGINLINDPYGFRRRVMETIPIEGVYINMIPLQGVTNYEIESCTEQIVLTIKLSIDKRFYTDHYNCPVRSVDG
ncbi:MAG: hypothetical protein FWG63_01395 [Defluviitaleaceae bacterium]|nr:hypothetical protein [Defluviitaleaceae bacterium]